MPRKPKKHPVLTAQEERLLINRIRAGDSRALDWFVSCNIRLVHKIANKHKGKLEYDDLVQEGLLGLLTAMDKFDPDLGYKFSTMAHWWIESAMTRAVGDKARTIRLPIHIVEDLNRFRWKYTLLAADKGCEPNLGELVKFTKLSSDKVQLFLRYMDGSLLSLDKTFGDSEDSLTTMITDDSAIDAGELVSAREVRRSIDQALDDYLDERQKRILCWRFGLIDGQPKTLDQVGVRLGITRERVRQIEAVALEKLRRLHPDVLEDFRQVDLSVLSSEQGVRQMAGISREQIELEAKRLGFVTARMALEELRITHSNPSTYFQRLYAVGLEVAHQYGPANLYRLEDVRAAVVRLKDSSPTSAGSSGASAEGKGGANSGYSGNLAAMSKSTNQPPSENGDGHSQPSDSPPAANTSESSLLDKVVEQASLIGGEEHVYQVVQSSPVVQKSRQKATEAVTDVASAEKSSYNATLIRVAIYLAGSKTFREMEDEEQQEKIVSEIAGIEFYG